MFENFSKIDLLLLQSVFVEGAILSDSSSVARGIAKKLTLPNYKRFKIHHK